MQKRPKRKRKRKRIAQSGRAANQKSTTESDILQMCRQQSRMRCNPTFLFWLFHVSRVYQYVWAEINCYSCQTKNNKIVSFFTDLTKPTFPFLFLFFSPFCSPHFFLSLSLSLSLFLSHATSASNGRPKIVLRDPKTLKNNYEWWIDSTVILYYRRVVGRH